MSKLTIEKAVTEARCEIYAFKIKVLSKQKEAMDKFWQDKIQQAQLSGANKTQMAQLRSIYVDAIEKIELEITEVQGQLDSIK